MRGRLRRYDRRQRRPADRRPRRRLPGGRPRRGRVPLSRGADSPTRRPDVIDAFDGGSDVIDVSAIDADSGRPGNQAFRFIHDDRFGGDAGELRVQGNTLSADIDGDRQADFAIALRGQPDLTARDLIL
ncbi:MAG TPA: M10 family metallopeptidase C-terminal domain-containing protein [Amaricoccus sp.]|nr:M10 family metallopeptidase C-terminal domain-containing protein [Amaricoccus sp.]